MTAFTIEFVVITQWEHLRGLSAVEISAALPTPQPQEQTFQFDTPKTTSSLREADAQDFLLRRIAPISITDPKVGRDGTIGSDHQPIALHGIKPFDARNVCTRASGERWACGLQAYATLRNELAYKTIVCEPKQILADSLSATCRMGDQNVAAILVRRGLAETAAGADADLIAAQAEARQRKVGIWDQ